MSSTTTGAIARSGTAVRTRAASGPRPCAIVTIQRAITVVAGIHILALVLVLIHQDIIRGVIAADSAGMSADRIQAAADSAVLQSVIPHIVIPVLLVWRARGLASGRRSARIGLTILLLVQLAAHATLPLVLHRLPGFELETVAVQGVSLAFEILALARLWMDRNVRAWFAPDGGW